MDNMKTVIRYLDKNFERIICVISFSMLIILTFLQVLFRFVFNFSLSWTEELARFTFIGMVYMAVSLAASQRKHIRVEIIDKLVATKFRSTVHTITDSITVSFFLVISYYGILQWIDLKEIHQLTPALQIPLYLIYGIVPFALILTSFRTIQVIYKRYHTEEGK